MTPLVFLQKSTTNILKGRTKNTVKVDGCLNLVSLPQFHDFALYFLSSDQCSRKMLTNGLECRISGGILNDEENRVMKLRQPKGVEMHNNSHLIF